MNFFQGRRNLGLPKSGRRLRRRSVAGEHVGQVGRPRSSPHLLRHPRHQHRKPEGRARILQSILANLLSKPHPHLRSVATHRLLQGLAVLINFIAANLPKSKTV